MPHMKLSPITGHLLTIHADAVSPIMYNILEPAAPKALILVVLSMMYPLLRLICSKCCTSLMVSVQAPAYYIACPLRNLSYRRRNGIFFFGIFSDIMFETQ